MTWVTHKASKSLFRIFKLFLHGDQNPNTKIEESEENANKLHNFFSTVGDSLAVQFDKKYSTKPTKC